MKYVLWIVLAECVLCAAVGAQEQPTNACPVCQATAIVNYGTIRGNTNMLGRNYVIWNRSFCGDLLHNDHSPVCTNCWYASNLLNGDWNLALASITGFHFPLRKEIVDFPLPSDGTGALYEQTISGNSIVDRVRLWTKLDLNYETMVRVYCKTNDIGLELNKHHSRGEMLVVGGVRTRINKTAAAPAGYDHYVVKEGDTLSKIANQFSDRDSMNEMALRNHISNANVIHAGQVLLIKQSQQ